MTSLESDVSSFLPDYGQCSSGSAGSTRVLALSRWPHLLASQCRVQ